MSTVTKPNRKSPWRPIKTAPKGFLREVDLWLKINPSARSMGWGDSFRVPNAFWMDAAPKSKRDTDPEKKTRDDWDAGWFHMEGFKMRRLNDEYITHWMPIPKPPKK